MLARIVLVAAAAVAIVALAWSLRDHDACEEARATVLGTATGALPADRQAAAIADVREHCRGATALISVAAVLHRQGRDGEAQRVAQEAVDAEPENATAWHALASTAAQRDPATARRAARRQVELSPLDPPAVPLDGAAGP